MSSSSSSSLLTANNTTTPPPKKPRNGSHIGLSPSISATKQTNLHSFFSSPTTTTTTTSTLETRPKYVVGTKIYKVRRRVYCIYVGVGIAYSSTVETHTQLTQLTLSFVCAIIFYSCTIEVSSSTSTAISSYYCYCYYCYYCYCCCYNHESSGTRRLLGRTWRMEGGACRSTQLRLL
jgi:hypothetical protein